MTKNAIVLTVNAMDFYVVAICPSLFSQNNILVHNPQKQFWTAL